MNTTGRKHNKRTNTALIHNALVRQITEWLVEGKQDIAKRTCDLIAESFSKDNNISKELKLARNLLEFKTDDIVHANSVLTRVRDAVCQLDEAALLSEKRNMINKIDRIDSSILDKHISNYKTIATIGTLFSEWRKPVLNQNMTLISQYEQTLLEHMTAELVPVVKEEIAADDMSVGERRALLSAMSRKLEEKWGKKILPSQREILRVVVSEDAERFGRVAVESVMELIGSVEKYKASPSHDAAVAEKAMALTSKLQSMNPDYNDDKVLASLLECCEISNELNKAAIGEKQ